MLKICSVCKKEIYDEPINHIMHDDMCYKIVCKICYNKMETENIKNHILDLSFILSTTMIFTVLYIFGLPALLFYGVLITSIIGILHCLFKITQTYKVSLYECMEK